MSTPTKPPVSTFLFVLFVLVALCLLPCGCEISGELGYTSPRGNSYSVSTNGRQVKLGARLGRPNDIFHDGKTIRDPLLE